MALFNSCGIYKDGVYYPMPHDFTATATVSGGNAVFSLTDPAGNAIFNDVFLSTMQIAVHDNTAIYQAGAPTLSSDKKTLTVPVNKLTVSSTLVSILGISVTQSITQSMTAAPNGTVAAILIEGVI